MSVRLMQMSLAETAIQLRREDCPTSPTGSLLGGLLCCEHYRSRAYSYHWSLPGGEMLIKQPASYRIFYFFILTLGSCPGPSTVLQGGLWLLGADGGALLEERPAFTLGQCLLDGKEKTFGCCTEPSQLQARSWSMSGACPLVVLIYFFDNVFSTRGHINSSYRYERASAPQHPRPGQSSPPAPSVTSQLSDLLSWTPEIRYS